MSKQSLLLAGQIDLGKVNESMSLFTPFCNHFFLILIFIRIGIPSQPHRHGDDSLEASCTATNQGPVVQSVVSLTSLLRVISFTILADSIYNILIFFAEKM